MTERAGCTKRQFIKWLDDAMRRVREGVFAIRGEGLYSRGLASEGYNGGYLEALHDVDAVLRHGYPADKLGYWGTRDHG
jgi:hypothetical protein